MNKQKCVSAKEAQEMFMKAFLVNHLEADEILRQYKDILGNIYINNINE